ncbi:acyl-CoA thioesterase [Herbaspirillum autotrophicum]|uniref:acyl-CoA thioesterase n=1 Tax=Herbaspirillum autotrophicum TaxID=180195 RepID=UPI00067B6946|nr:acyl-CoA thioesterase domain-containing protein [Herbaspirillum autotrophicum]
MQESTNDTAAWNGLDIDGLLQLRPESSRGGQADAGSSHFQSRYHDHNGNGRIFGGQLLGQALAAAQATLIQPRRATALQLIFAQGGLIGPHIDYRVRTLQEGKRFSTRHVEATQGGRILISAQISFQSEQDGREYAARPLALVPAPEELSELPQLIADLQSQGRHPDWQWISRPGLEIRMVEAERHFTESHGPARISYWIRTRQPLPDAPATQEAALAYLSDYWLISAAMTPHVALKDALDHFYVASLNHSLWFHRPCRADEWLLFSTESTNAAGQRALTNARIYDRHGTLVASASQECLLGDRNQ